MKEEKMLAQIVPGQMYIKTLPFQYLGQLARLMQQRLISEEDEKLIMDAVFEAVKKCPSLFPNVNGDQTNDRTTNRSP